MPLYIVTKPGAEEIVKTWECTVPGCTHGPFLREHEAQFRRHVKACVKRNADKLEAAVAKRESNYFTGIYDPELYAHIRKGGT